MFGKKYILLLALLLCPLNLILNGCGIVNQSVTFSQLISNADKYNGKTITLEAFYFSGFEISAISESVGPSTSGDWRIVPTGTLIWVEGGISQELQNKLYTQTTMPSGYAEHLGKLKITGKFETGSQYGHLDAYRYQIFITSAELLEWSPPPAATPVDTVTTTTDLTQAAAQKVAMDFVRNSSTFKFDGMAGSIDLAKSDPGFTSAYMSWSFSFKFETLHPGHGDRTGQNLPEAITAHYATILVNLENNTVVMAACDDTWDMVKDRDLSVYITGVVIGGGDTTPEGLFDAPRVFVYKIMRDQGVINVSYTAYPPSPAGDIANAKITMELYTGDIRTGDKMEAYGTLDKQTNTLRVANEGDYIKTFPVKTTVLGVVISISKTIPADNSGDIPGYVYELLRDDGTFINISYTAREGVALSLYEESIKVGDYMKAVGTYDKSTNTVIVAAGDDMIKTYDHNPVLTDAVWE